MTSEARALPPFDSSSSINNNRVISIVECLFLFL